jgi:hypothetical protein
MMPADVVARSRSISALDARQRGAWAVRSAADSAITASTEICLEETL